MGRDWLAESEVSLSDLKVIHQTEPIDPPAVDSPGPDPLQEILHKYSDVFSDDLGCLKDRTVQLTVHDNAPPKFFKPRPVPFLLKDKILQEQGIISPVQFSSWAAPIVPVLKKNKKNENLRGLQNYRQSGSTHRNVPFTNCRRAICTLDWW